MSTPQPKAKPKQPAEEPKNNADNKEKSSVLREGGMIKEGDYPQNSTGGMAGEV